MTPGQQAAFFCALPFLTLALAWLIGLSFLMPRAQPVKIEKKRRQ
jgi:hypothetical protein